MVLHWIRFNMNSISKNIIIVLCLANAALAGQGTVSGRVTDSSTGLALVGANVIVSGTNVGAASGLDGTFTLTSVNSGKADIVASMIGYNAQHYNCEVPTNGRIEISFTLDPVILEFGQNITVIGQSFENTTIEQYRNANLTSTEDMLSRLEGVDLISRGSFASEPIFRGLSGGQVNITIDGMKCFGACTDRMDPVSSYIEVDALNSVEIGKGALALENGGNVGGSLNMSHNRPEFTSITENNWYVRSEAQSALSGLKTAVNWTRNNPQWGMIINTTIRKAEDYTDASGGVIPYTSYSKINYNLGILARLSDRSELYFDFIGDDAYDVGYSALPMDVGYAQMRMFGLSTMTTGIRPWFPKFEFKIYGNYVNHWMDDSKRDELFMNMRMDMPGFTRTVGLYGDAVLVPREKQLLQLRSEFYYSTHYAEMVMHPFDSSPMKMVTWPAVLRWNFGEYLEYQLALNLKTTLKAALRYDFFWSKVTDEMGIAELHINYPDDPLERADHMITGNIFLDYRINSNWQTTLALAAGQRMPTVTEAYGYYLYVALDGYLYNGNPNLKKERSNQFEWRNRIETDWFDLGLNLYRYNLDDYIFGIVDPNGVVVDYANGWKNYYNVGEAHIQGVELSILSELDWHWSVFGGLNYEIGRLDDINDNLPMIPPLGIQGAIKYQLYPWWVQIEGKLSSRQEAYSAASGENETADYFIIGLRGEYLIRDGITLNIGVDNLTNVNYHDHLDWADLPQPGRNFYLSIAIDEKSFNGHKRNKF